MDKKEVLGKIDAVMMVLENLTNTGKNIGVGDVFENNLMGYITDIFKSLKCYDKLMDIISYVICFLPPVLEVAVKTSLMENMKNILSCSFNPFIEDRVLKEGVLLDLDKLDIRGSLNVCPLSNYTTEKGKVRTGSAFYFGCDDFNTTEELVKATDFDALLWYAVNKAKGRVVWLGHKKAYNNPIISRDEKQTKDEGVITLEFNEFPNSIKNALGEDMHVQVPVTNQLHVFIGNVKEIRDTNQIEETLASIESDIALYEKLEADVRVFIDKLEKSRGSKDNLFDTSFDTPLTGQISGFNRTQSIESFEQFIKDLKGSKSLSELYNNTEKPKWWFQITEDGGTFFLNYDEQQDAEIIVIPHLCWGTSYSEKVLEKMRLETMREGRVLGYRTLDKNYYYRKTLFEFNFDYIWSLKLFDRKTLMSCLVDTIVNFTSIDLQLTVEQNLIKKKIESIILSVANDEEYEVSDCFFSFANDQYNAMIDESLSERYGFSCGNHNLSDEDRDKIATLICDINDESSSEDVDKIFKDVMSIVEKGGFISDSRNGTTVTFGAKVSFLENVLNNLFYAIISSVLTPKLYLLMAVNLKLLGSDANFDLDGFIERNKMMFINIINSIKEVVLSFIKEKLLEIINEMCAKIIPVLNLEQYSKYVALLKSCVDCLNIFGWNKNGVVDLDDVEYADIYNNLEESDKSIVTNIRKC